jgi:hypothetical protein
MDTLCDRDNGDSERYRALTRAYLAKLMEGGLA